MDSMDRKERERVTDFIMQSAAHYGGLTKPEVARDFATKFKVTPEQAQQIIKSISARAQEKKALSSGTPPPRTAVSVFPSLARPFKKRLKCINSSVLQSDVF